MIEANLHPPHTERRVTCWTVVSYAFHWMKRALLAEDFALTKSGYEAKFFFH